MMNQLAFLLPTLKKKPKNAEDDDVEMENQMPQKENSEESFNMFKK
jgi:hypothetical protein